MERDEELVGEVFLARLAGLHEIADLVDDLVCNGLARLAVCTDGRNDDRRTVVTEADAAIISRSEGIDIAYDALEGKVPDLFPLDIQRLYYQLDGQ